MVTNGVVLNLEKFVLNDDLWQNLNAVSVDL